MALRVSVSPRLRGERLRRLCGEVSGFIQAGDQRAALGLETFGGLIRTHALLGLRRRSRRGGLGARGWLLLWLRWRRRRRRPGRHGEELAVGEEAVAGGAASAPGRPGQADLIVEVRGSLEEVHSDPQDHLPAGEGADPAAGQRSEAIRLALVD